MNARRLWLFASWLVLLTGGAARGFAGGEINLAESDALWLREHPVIEFGYDPAWKPFSERDAQGRFSGLDADMLALLGRRLGVEFRPRHHADWTEAYQSAVAGDIPLLTGTATTPERRARFNFTRPYVTSPLIIITRADEEDFDDLARLVGRRVAGVKNYAATLSLRRDFPEIEEIPCDTVAEGLKLVSVGRADALLTNLLNANHVMREEGITGLKIAGIAPYTLQLRLAVRRDQPELLRALDAAIASLSDAERQTVLAPYVRLDNDAILSRARVWRWTLGVGTALLAAAVVGGWYHLRLRRELAERLRLQRELLDSHTRLTRLNEEKSGLMRMAAHDLRNPLSGILLSIDLLRMDEPTTRRQGLDRMVVLVEQMMHMIRNLLDVEALESGTRQVRSERISLGFALRETLATFEPVARRKSITLHFGESEPGLAVLADRAALRQVCDNLVSNAVKYSPEGSTVRVAAARSAAGRVRLCVGDEGPGVRPDEMDRLFQRYTCLSARPTGGESSTGLGLSIVKELVVRMEGRIWCESTPGRGASFLVELPEAPATAPDTAEPHGVSV